MLKFKVKKKKTIKNEGDVIRNHTYMLWFSLSMNGSDTAADASVSMENIAITVSGLFARMFFFVMGMPVFLIGFLPLAYTHKGMYFLSVSCLVSFLACWVM